MSESNWSIKLGNELVVGDVIAPWYRRTATITRIGPYTGPLAHLWEKQGGARIAELSPTAVDGLESFKFPSITVEPFSRFRVYTRSMVS